MSKQVQPQEEEIDLGGFFNQIGKLFSKLFSLIGNIFKGLYHLLITSLIFVKKYYLKLGIAIVVGAILGFFIEKNTSKIYRYDMIVEPNYDAAYQLNERVQFYNQLIANENYGEISKLFSIDADDAKSILKFNLKRQDDLKDTYESYDKFIQDKDSITVANIPFEKYAKKHFSDFNSRRYLLRMELRKNNLNTNIQDKLLADIENNKHLQEQKAEMLLRLNFREKNIIKLITDIDSLRYNDKLIALTAAKNGNLSTTNIDLNKEPKTDDKDISLFKIFKDAYQDLEYVLREKEKFNSIIRVVTPFEPLGRLHNGILANKIILVPLLSLFLTILFILSKPLFVYLDEYKKGK